MSHLLSFRLLPSDSLYLHGHHRADHPTLYSYFILQIIMISLFFILSTLVSTIVAAPCADDHNHARRSALPTAWHHKRDHPVHQLFRRGPLPAVGSQREFRP